MKKEHVESLEEIIFKDRNQEYGAYSLRKNYGNHIIIALFIAVLFIGSALTYPLIMMPGHEQGKDNDTIVIEVTPFKPIQPVTTIPVPQLPSVPKQSVKPPVFVVPRVSDEPETTDFGKQADLASLTPVSTAPISDPGITTPAPAPPVIVEPAKPEPRIWVEEMPRFPGGDAELSKFLRSRIKYTTEAKEANIEGTVYLTFVVETDGSVTGIAVLRGIGGGCEEEAIRVIKTMPHWIPGRQNGIPVRVRFNLPVKFTLQ